MATRTATLIARLVDDVSKPASGMAKAMHKAAEEAKALTKLRDAGGGGKLVADLRKLGATAGEIKTVTEALKKFTATQGIVKGADWTKTQVQAVRTWEHSVVANMRAVKRAQDETAASARNLASAQLQAAVRAGEAQRRERIAAQRAAIQARQQVIERRRESVGALAGAVGGYKAKQFSADAVNQAADMDIAVRKQRIATDVTEGMQRRLLIPQAKRIGQDTQFSNIDIVKAQTATMQSLPFNDPDLKAEIGAALVDQVKNYAQIMEADMTRSAEGLRSFLQTTNKDISTKEKAVAEATRGTNLLVKMAKRGGMSDDDVQAFTKYGFPTATQAGLSDTTVGALGSVGRRGGLRGDELGVFVRAVASKLIAPTIKGREALIAAGIDIDKFTKMPGGLSPETLEKFQANRFGKKFTESQRSRIGAIINNEETGLPSREDFITQVSEIVSESFQKTKKGKTKAQDSQKIAKMVGDFYKMSVESMDSEGLLQAILTNPRMTAALRNAFFTDKHGGKAGILADKMDQFREDKAELDHVTQDPEFSTRKATEIMGGLGGSLNQLKGAVETLTLSFGEANSGIAKLSFDKLSDLAGALTSLPDGAKQAATALAAVGTAYGVAKGAQGFLGGFGLQASATALDGSAAALTRAAIALGASGGGALPGTAGKATGVLGKMGAAGFIGTAGLGIVAVGAGFGLVDAYQPNRNRMNGYGAGFDRTTSGISSYPAGWGAGGLDVSGNVPAPSTFTTQRPKTWSETIFGSTRAGSRDPTKMDLPIPATMSGGAPKVDASQIDGLGSKADEAKGKLDDLNAVSIAPKVDAGQIDTIGPKADTAKGKLSELGTISVAPNVSTASLDQLIAKIATARSGLAGLGADAARANASIASVNAGSGKVASALAGAAADRGMG